MKFYVKQKANYVMGHLRYGHREGVIEADSKEDLLNKLKKVRSKLNESIQM